MIFVPLSSPLVLNLAFRGKLLRAYIDQTPRVVLQVDTDAEIDEVVNGIAQSAESVDGIFPSEVALVPPLGV